MILEMLVDSFIRLVLVLADPKGRVPQDVLLLLLLSGFRRVRLCAQPTTMSRLVAKTKPFYREHGSAVGLI